MEKLILLALTALMMVGCNMKQTTENIEAPFGGDITNTKYQTILIDSCEYITGTRSLAHKGNCRFCEEHDSIKWEKRKKELKELVIK
jgi:hypothetical protein